MSRGNAGSLKKSKYCLFKRGDVSGKGNYTVGIAKGDELVRTIHMLDSNGCKDGDDPSVIKTPGIYNDQLAMISENTAKILNSQKKTPPVFLAFHIPTEQFFEAERAKGYLIYCADHRLFQPPLYFFCVPTQIMWERY